VKSIGKEKISFAFYYDSSFLKKTISSFDFQLKSNILTIKKL